MEIALRALGASLRREILALVRESELSVGEIAGHFDVTQPAISQHLAVLKDAGLVSERREGTRRLYRARPQGFVELRHYLEGFWDSRLDALRREAESEERKQRGRAGSRERAAKAGHTTEGRLD